MNGPYAPLPAALVRRGIGGLTAMREAVIVALACFMILILALALIVHFVPQ
jgi:hypothetical protein